MAANIKALEARVEGCQNNIEKLKKTLERHQSRRAKKLGECEKAGVQDPAEGYKNHHDLGLSHDQYWACCDWNSANMDVRNTEKKIAEFEQKLVMYRQKLKEAKAENDVPMIPSVEEFLSNWKQCAEKFYLDEVDSIRKWNEWYRGYREAQLQEMCEKYGEYSVKYCSSKELKEEKTQRKIQYGYARQYLKDHYHSLSIELSEERDFKQLKAKLNHILDQEVINKRVDLYQRCSKVVGKILDASNLFLGAKGTIDGYVVGENGKARVETIPAGGYNVQIFHYRVLVKAIN